MKKQKSNLGYYHAVRKEIVEFLPNKYNKVLEIGCADGNFRSLLKSHEEYWGVELAEDVALLASNNLSEVLTGSFFEVFDRLPDNYFDLVICNDVIEHMADHEAFMCQVRSKCVERFYLVGSVPNIRYLPYLLSLIFIKDWKYEDAGVLDKTHLRFFTKKSLIRSFIENRYEVQKVSGINGIKKRVFPISRLFKNILIFVFGCDTRYPQYGFRVLNLKREE